MMSFPKEEYLKRLDNIHKKLENENIDAIVITSPANFRYFSGLDSNFWESPTRPWFLIISKNGKIKALVPSIGLSAIESTFIKDIEIWQSPNPNDEGTSLLKKIIASMSDNLYEIDSAMNMIKEEIIRELSESVSKQNKNPYLHPSSSKNLSFSEKASD